MSHTRELRRQVPVPWCNGGDAFDEYQGQKSRRFLKKQRRTHVRCWNKRETIRLLDQSEQDTWLDESEELRQEREGWEEYTSDQYADCSCCRPEWDDEYAEDRDYWYDQTEAYREYWYYHNPHEAWSDELGYARDIHCWIVPDYWCQTHGRDAADCLY